MSEQSHEKIAGNRADSADSTPPSPAPSSPTPPSAPHRRTTTTRIHAARLIIALSRRPRAALRAPIGANPHRRGGGNEASRENGPHHGWQQYRD